jgi:hypothetical protein
MLPAVVFVKLRYAVSSVIHKLVQTAADVTNIIARLQGRSIHVNRVSSANILKKCKIKSLTVVVQWYSINWKIA